MRFSMIFLQRNKSVASQCQSAERCKREVAGSQYFTESKSCQGCNAFFIIKKLKLFMEIVEGGKGNLPNKISYKKRTWNAPDIQKLSPQLYIPVVHFCT